MSTHDSADKATLHRLVPAPDTELQMTVFVHSLAPVESKESQDRLVRRVDSLGDRGVVDAVDLEVWGTSICTASPVTRLGSGRRIIDAITEFYDRAAESDFSVAPFFRRSSVSTEYSDEEFRRIVPPQRAVALYEAGDLAAVFPCLVDGTAYTPEDLLRYLEQRQNAAREPLVVDESA